MSCADETHGAHTKLAHINPQSLRQQYFIEVSLSNVLLVKSDQVTRMLASDWSKVIEWPRCWHLIGPNVHSLSVTSPTATQQYNAILSYWIWLPHSTTPSQEDEMKKVIQVFSATLKFVVVCYQIKRCKYSNREWRSVTDCILFSALEDAPYSCIHLPIPQILITPFNFPPF